MELPKFEYAARRTRRVNVDHGPDTFSFWKDFWRILGIVLLFALCLVVAALSMWFENVEDS